MRLVIVMTALVMFGYGCGDKSDASGPDKPSDTRKPKSTMETFVEGVTGKAAIDSGRKAQQKIRDLSEKHDQDLNAIMEN